MAKAKKWRIEPTFFQCPNCKKKYFSYQERMWCPDCTKDTKEDEKEADRGMVDDA